MVSDETLADWVDDARERSLEIVADLSDERMMGPRLAIVNPLLWEIGHGAWFQERWVLRHCGGEKPIREDGDSLFDSIAIAHDTRWDLPLPSREEMVAYLGEVRSRVLRRIERGGLSDEEAYHIRYSLLHEDMHTEAYTYSRQTLGDSPPRLAISPGGDQAAADIGGGPLPGDAAIPGGTYLLGALPDEPFAFDNEKWAHPVEVKPFAIARAPVTQSEFAAFVDGGGYRKEEFWDDAGGKWKSEAGAEHPAYWRQEPDGKWQRRHFDKWVPLEPHLPVIHVCWHEARAFCRWAGRRLPTEAEWELAASGEPDPGGEGFPQRKRRYPWGEDFPAPRRANLDWRAMGCVDVGAHPEGDSAFGCRQMAGNVWEWTSSDFLPFPGFTPDPYKDYSQPLFENTKVFRGGCWVTRSRLIRNNYRNYNTPDRRDLWVGFRTCAREA